MRIRQYHEASDGVMGMPRMHEELGYDGEAASRNRVAQLMSRHGLFGVPRRRSVRSKRPGIRPDHVRNHLERDFPALEPNTKWVTDCSMSAVGHCAGNAVAEGFFGMIKRERIHRQCYLTLADGPTSLITSNASTIPVCNAESMSGTRPLRP